MEVGQIVERQIQMRLCFPFLLAGALFLASASPAQEEFTPVYHPTLEVTRASGTIKIDGELNDAGWQGAARADNFAEHQPGDQTKPPVETEAFITCDDHYLYVAFVCYDDPKTVRASLCDRDGPIYSDDNICFLLDTYGDAAWAYELNVNPYGVQADALWSPYGGEDSGYDMIWKSAGKITDCGYQIEMAVPFSSLRFPNKEKQVWKVDFWRNHPREVRRQYSWAAYDRDEPCWPCQWGTVTGIENIRPGRGLEIMPTLIGYQSGDLDDDDNFRNDDPDGDLSLGAKYSVSSNIVAEATYNPDFSQVEADPAQVDVNTNFALFYQERRPFFQEGSDLFNTIFDAVYTRSINDPQFAAKLTARMSRTSVAYLVARDENTTMILPFEERSTYLVAGKSSSNVLRSRRTIGEDSHVGLLLTDRRRDEGGSGTLLGADGRFRLSKKYQFHWQLLGTYTQEPHDTMLTFDEDDSTFNSLIFDSDGHTAGFDGESYWGHALYTGISRETANSYVELDYLERSPTFRADNGFQPRNNQRRLGLYAQYVFRFEGDVLDRIIPSVEAGRELNFEEVKKDEFVGLDLCTNFRAAQTEIHSRFMRSAERLAGIKFGKIWNLHTCMHSIFSGLISAGGSINYGHTIARREDPPVMGKQTTLSAWVDLKPIDRVLLENSIVYEKNDDLDTDENIYEGYIARTRLNYQILKDMSLRVVLQYDNFDQAWDFDPLLTYRLNPFSIFYVGSTSDYQEVTGEEVDSRDWRLTSRQFFLKLQYLFQL